MTRRRWRDQRGQVALEFTGFLPLLLLAAVAAIQLGLAGYAAVQAGTAARAAARVAGQEDPGIAPAAAGQAAAEAPTEAPTKAGPTEPAAGAPADAAAVGPGASEAGIPVLTHFERAPVPIEAIVHA